MWIVFLEVSTSFSDAFKAAHELGAKVLLLSAKELSNIPGGEIGPTKVVQVENWNIETIKEIVTREVGKVQSITAWTLLERLSPIARKLNEAFHSGGNWPSEESFWVTKNKFMMRKGLDGTDLNPKYVTIERSDLGVRPFPGSAIVVKPFEGHSSIGVELLEAASSHNDFVGAANRSFSVLESIATAMTGDRPNYLPSPTQSLLVEEYIGGLEYSVEVFMSKGNAQVVGICGKSPMKAPYFEEVSYLMPANIETETRNRLADAAIKAVSALGLTTGMAHVELKDGPNGPKILDIGLRLGGSGLTHDLVLTAYGIDLVKAVLAEILGQSADNFLVPSKHNTALLYLMQVGCGGLIQTLPSTTDVPGLTVPIRFAYFVNVGDKLTSYPSYSGTPGFALFSIAGQNKSSMMKASDVIDLCQRYLRFKYLEEAKIK